MFNSDGPRSSSPNPFKLLDGISLSPEPISAAHSSHHITTPRFSPQVQNNQLEGRLGALEGEVRGGLLRLRPSSSITGVPPGLSQWESQASPAPNLLGITISDVEKNMGKASEAAQESLPHLLTGQNGDRGITYDFSPNTVARQTSLFPDILSSSEREK